MSEGYIFLHRKIIDSRVFANAELLKVWLWTLLKANHTTKWWSINTGKGFREVECKRGQLIIGRNKASSELNMSPSKTYSLVKKLHRIGMLKMESKTHYTLITIFKYTEYQRVMSASAQATNTLPTDYQPATNNQPTTNNTNNNVNNVKKEKNVNKKTCSLHSRLKISFEKTYNETTGDDYYWTAKDAGNLTRLLKKIKYTLTQKKLDSSEADIELSFNALIQNLPQWYKDNAFDVSTINSNYNKILNQLINGKEQSTNNLQSTLSKIDDLFA